MQIRIPTRTLVVLCGPAGAGKSTFAAQHFQPTQIVSSDTCRALVCDQLDNQDVNRQAFDLFHHILQLRLGLGRLSVADSTALSSAARQPLLEMVCEAGFATCLLVFSFRRDVYQRQNGQRTKPLPDEVIFQQHAQLRRHTLREIYREPWDQLFLFEEWPRDLRFGRPRRRGSHRHAGTAGAPPPEQGGQRVG